MVNDPAVAPETGCAFCGSRNWHQVGRFDRRPDGETDFGIADYLRVMWKCAGCAHVINRYGFDLSAAYDGGYWDSTYADKIRQTFDRIMALPPGQSDNRQRVQRVNAFWGSLPDAPERSLLDIGAGLAVFPAVMQAEGWSCHALDPDPRAADHAEAVAGVSGITADFMSWQPDRRFGLVTLNKVLEHVTTPVEMLARVRDCLLPGGHVYLELPDAEGALADSPAREEFFVEHYCAYSMASTAILIHKAGFRAELMERVVEPSSKYTLRAFLSLP